MEGESGQDGGRQEWTRARVALAAAIALIVTLFAIGLLWLAFQDPPPAATAVRLALAPAETASDEGASEVAAPSRPAAETPGPPAASAVAPPAAPPAASAPRAETAPASAAPADARPRIAIVIGGLGLSAATTRAAIETLPAEVSLAFTPYAADLAGWLAQARAAGHESLLELPMEPESYPESDPGPQVLLTGRPAADNRARLDWLLERAEGYAGVTNALGGRFLSDPNALRPILEALAERDLVFVVSAGAPSDVAHQIARDLGLAFAAGRLALDRRADAAAIDAALAELETLARADGAAVGTAAAYPLTLARIAQWAPRLGSRGLVLVPVSAIARDLQPSPQVSHDDRS